MGLVGPNGAGKTTLLHIAVGCCQPPPGSIEVLGGKPASVRRPAGQGRLRRPGRPTYAGLSVADHLRFGAHTNPGWDQQLAEDRIIQVGLDPSQKAGKLSGGQRAQLALTLAIAKRPELLILDEPVSSLDPLGSAGVPAEPDGVRRRAWRQRDPVLAPGLGPGARLRLPDRARRLPGPGRR